ncbi:MAG: phosphodiesterase [Lachnospiraceae bacterium]|nr:phosphodiesterase [Lachnospiraceae bacterium]
MKYVFASDIHGSAYYCKKLLDRAAELGADRIVLLGDLLYHGPRNDLPKDYAPKQVIEMLNAVKEKLICVRGNCEAEVDQMVLNFPVLSDFAVLELDGQRMYLTHGHHYNIDTPLPMCEGDIMLYGHTHITLDEVRDGRRFLNPGSVSIPKNNTGHGFLFYENGEFTRLTLE